MRLLGLALGDERKHRFAHGFGAAHGFVCSEPLVAPVMNFTVASEFTSQCETASARACA